METILIYFYVFYLGACFGSFLTMASYRVPKGEDIIFKSSYCPICKKKLKLSSLFPIFSWLFQKGKCSNCGSKISIRYPLIEIFTAIGFLTTYFLVKDFKISYQLFFYSLFLLCTLISIIDIETYEIPYALQIIFTIYGLIFVIFSKKNIIIHLIASLTYFLTFYLLSYLLSKYKKTDTLGGGDLGLIIGIGLFLGFRNINVFLFLSGLNGLIFGLLWLSKLNKKIFPFAPSLFLAFFITLIINCYSMFGL